jgi:hypothetical protein
MQPRFNRIEARLPRTKASLQPQYSSSTFNLQICKYHYKPCSKLKVKLIQTVFKPTSLTACPCSQRKGNKHATTYVAEVDTMLSPMPGVTPEDHCQPGTDPTPRTSHVEQKLATQNYLRGSRRLYLKMLLANFSFHVLVIIHSRLAPTLSKQGRDYHSP